MLPSPPQPLTWWWTLPTITIWLPKRGENTATTIWPWEFLRWKRRQLRFQGQVPHKIPTALHLFFKARCWNIGEPEPKKPRNLTWLVEVWGIHDSYHHVDRLDDSISINIRYLTNQKYTAHGNGCFFLLNAFLSTFGGLKLTFCTRLDHFDSYFSGGSFTYLFAAPGCRSFTETGGGCRQAPALLGIGKRQIISRVIFHSVLGTFDENPILVVFLGVVGILWFFNCFYTNPLDTTLLPVLFNDVILL